MFFSLLAVSVKVWSGDENDKTPDSFWSTALQLEAALSAFAACRPTLKVSAFSAYVQICI
ncbi:hypothetical protein B472_13050 [Limnohabitans sp. Rim28]|nr:hypothetical protein B472_13050 [Limnohabitans sp. Rim28]